MTGVQTCALPISQRRLQAYLPIDWEGNWYNAMDAWMTLLGAVSMNTSMAAVCREGQEAPSDNTLREKLNEQGWNDRLIETACNDILAQSVRQCSWLGAFPVVIDLHEMPFYGQAPKDDADVIRRGKAKAGTTSFHTFATAYVSRRHRRFTLALSRVRAHESMLDVADRLRQRVEALGIDVQVYLLDRQFWTYELLAAWQEIPYIMPIRRTGKSGADGGTRPLFDLQESQFLTYTMSPKHQEPLDMNVAVVVLPETRKERQARLAKAKIACENAQQRVDDKAKALKAVEDYTTRYYGRVRNPVEPVSILGGPDQCIDKIHYFLSKGLETLIIGVADPDHARAVPQLDRAADVTRRIQDRRRKLERRAVARRFERMSGLDVPVAQEEQSLGGHASVRVLLSMR